MASKQTPPRNPECNKVGSQKKVPMLIQSLVLLLLLGTIIVAPVLGVPGWKFHADNQNTGVYDEGGNRPGGFPLWKFTAGEAITSSPSLVNGVVYVGSNNYNLYAVDASTGSLIWNYTTEPNNYVSTGPAVVNGIVYAGGLRTKIYALDASTGGLLWNYTVPAPSTVRSAISSSPAVADGVVYVGNFDNNIYAFNASTGSLLWNYTTGNSVFSSPAVVNGIVYVGSCDNNLYALDASTGSLLWSYTTGNQVISSPAVVNGIVYVGSRDNYLYALDASTGTLLWNYMTGDLVDSSPAVSNGVVYFGSYDNNTYALDASTGTLLWTYTTGAGVRSSPAIANGVIYVGSNDNNTYALNASTGSLLWNYTTGNQVISSPAVVNGVVYIGSRDSNIYALGSPPITGGGTGYYLVHSNVEGADVYFNNDWYEGKIENGTLLVRTCITCTPVWTFTVKKCGYIALTQNNNRYPGKNEIIDLYANLTHPKEPLIVDFSSNKTAGPAPLTVGFTSHSIGIAETWNWSFGDGIYSEDKDPVHTYTRDGIYTVSLSETNSACQNNTMVKKDYVTISKAPNPSFIADFTVTPVSGIAPLTVKCTDKSIGKPSTLVYDFGDGTNVTGPNPTHTYRFPGVYTITLSIMKYNTTTYSVMSSVATKPDVITVNSVPFFPPVAKFTASPVKGKAPLTVTFTDQSMGDPTFYSYNFGDGLSANEKNPVHTYRFPGTYNVTLTVMKNNAWNGTMVGDTSVQKDLIEVTRLPVPETPVICNQPYGLCTIAKCKPLESDPTKATCTCLIEDGVSLGMTSCGERQPVDLYHSGNGEWMIVAGARTGKFTSTYSFINALPKEEGKIPNRDIDPNYTGNIVLKYCDKSVWANCLDMKCVVPSANPHDDISVDHKAADYAVCECEMVRDSPLHYMASSGGEESCTDQGLCGLYIWSAAYLEQMNAGIGSLKAYLAAHPEQDKAQQYTMPICEACENRT